MRRVRTERPTGKGRFIRSLFGVTLGAATWTVLIAATASGHADALTTFASTPSSAQIVQGQSVTEVATAVGNSTLGLPAAPIAIQNVSTIATSLTLGASGGFPGVRAGDIATGDGLPAGSAVAAISPATSTVTLNNAATKTGTATVTFSIYPAHFTVCLVSPGTTACSGSPVTVTASKTDANAATNTRTYTSDPFTPPSAGTWCFTASYIGDGRYPTATASNPTAECVTVTPALTRFTAAPSATQIPLGQQVSDQAAAVGDSTSGTPSGKTVFQNVTTVSGSVTLAVSGGFPGVALGDPISGPGIPAGSTVVTNSPVGQTIAMSAAATASSTTAAVTFGKFPVHFTVCQVSSGTTCSGAATPVDTAGSTPNAAAFTRTYTSASFTPSGPGTWCFAASFTGDPVYADVTESNHLANCVAVSSSATTTVVTTTTTEPGTTTTSPGTTKTVTTTTPGGKGGRTVLHAQLVEVKQARSKLGSRLVEAEVITNKTTTVVLTLTRDGKTLASKTAHSVHAGDSVLVLAVSGSVAKGPARIRLDFTGAHQAHAALASSVSLPRP